MAGAIGTIEGSYTTSRLEVLPDEIKKCRRRMMAQKIEGASAIKVCASL
jgi:hypothetical protein